MKENDLKKNADPLRVVSNTFKRFIAEFIECLLFALREENSFCGLLKGLPALNWKKWMKVHPIGDFQWVHFFNLI